MTDQTAGTGSAILGPTERLLPVPDTRRDVLANTTSRREFWAPPPAERVGVGADADESGGGLGNSRALLALTTVPGATSTRAYPRSFSVHGCENLPVVARFGPVAPVTAMASALD